MILIMRMAQEESVTTISLRLFLMGAGGALMIKIIDGLIETKGKC